MVRIFIVYGGTEGLGYGTTINNYFKKNGLNSFLASRNSPDMISGMQFQPQIDYNFIDRDISIVVITSGLRNSIAAMDELRQILSDPEKPWIPYEKMGAEIPQELTGIHTVRLPSKLDDNELKDLELKMWRLLDISKIQTRKLIESSGRDLKPLEVPYIG